MSRIVFSILMFVFYIPYAYTQQVAVDKNKVLDLFQNQQFEEAISYLSTDLGNDSGNLQRLGFLGYAYYMNDDYRSAENFYRKMFMIDTANITAMMYIVNINQNTHPDVAQQFGFRLISMQPDKASNYRLMADLLKMKGEKDSALIYYNQAYRSGAGDYKNVTGLADMLIEKKQFQRADSILEGGLVKDSISIPYLRLRVKSAYEASDYQSALIPGEKLLRHKDFTVKTSTQLILSYYNLKRYEDCIRVCEFIIFNGLDIEAVYYYEAKSYAKLKNFAKSNELLEICLNKTKSPTAEMYYYNLGQNYEAVRQYKKAVPYYDTAFYLFKDPIMNYNSGIILETELKNPKAAKSYFIKYLAKAKPRTADEIKAYEYVRSRWGKKKK